jgi:excisionase family DNA binding protein
MSSNITVQRICEHCGKEFTAKTTITRYCSPACNKAGYKARLRTSKVESSNMETLKTKLRPLEELVIKPFLSIGEACVLLGISRRTIYRMLERGEIIAGKAGNRTIFRRSDFDKLFEQNAQFNKDHVVHTEVVEYKICDCYNLTEVQRKYGISEKALHELIKRNGIPKLKKGWYAYVPKSIIDKLLN